MNSQLPASKRPLISICIAAYNAEHYIGETLECFLGQSYPDFEVIVVDDQSADATVRTVEKYILKDDRIKIYTAPKQGAAKCRNEAFSHSKGEYIIFFDADDLVNETYIESQVQALAGKKTVIAACKLKRFFNNDPGTSLHEPLATWQDLRPLDWLVIDNGKGLGMMQCGMFIIPRALLEKSGLWNEKLTLIDDFEFFPRLLLQAEQIVFNSSGIVYYRSGIQNSLSYSKGAEKLGSALKAMTLTHELLIAVENSERMKKVLIFFWSEWTYLFYPKHIEYYKQAIKMLTSLGVKKFKPLYNGGLTAFLNPLLGWKLTKRIKTWNEK